MRLVSNNSDKDLAKRETSDALGFGLREMAANLIRVVRGAGRPQDLSRHLVECLAGFQAFAEAHGHYPQSDAIRLMLDPQRRWPDGPDEQDDYWDRLGNEPSQEELWSLEHHSLREDMRRAALQITASMLVEQRTQRSAGDHDMGEAIRAHERVTEERRVTRLKGQVSARSAKANSPRKASGPKLTKKRSGAELVVESARQGVVPSAKAVSQLEPRDPFDPPNYSGIRSSSLPSEIADEFGASTALDLVQLLNALWKAEGKKPLAQGSFPSNATKLSFVVKEIRLARLRTLTSQ